MKSRLHQAGTCLMAVLLAAACGGGNDSENLVPSSSVAAACRAPRSAAVLDANGRPYPDHPGSLDNELSWVRSWIDETYLWYADVRDLPATTLDRGRWGNPVDYFQALRSPLGTASGRPRDRFHFTYDTPAWVALSGSGVDYGYGFGLAVTQPYAPRRVIVTQTQAGSAAAAARVPRGAEVLTADGVDVVNANTLATVDTLNEALFPSHAGPHTFTLRDNPASAPHTLTLYADVQVMDTVPQAMVLPPPNQDVGYIRFEAHHAPAEARLFDAFTALAAAGVKDLVLDLRYNGGGLLDIANETAFMVAGPAHAAGKTFETLQYNDRNPFGLTLAQRTRLFRDRTVGFSTTAGLPLPTLGLGRVYVLTTDDTCSASESIINGLRGVGVQVVLVGATTCGKPYGFYPTDNCGVTYFTIQFQGVNAQGFGDYADGFAPDCAVADDFAHALGDPAEQLLATALGHRRNGTCSAAAQAQALALRPAPDGLALRRPAWRDNRFLRNER